MGLIIPAAIRPVLMASSLANMMTAMGITASAQSILDDISTDAILTTLGGTATGLNVFKAANAGAARSAISAGVGWVENSENAGFTAVDGEYNSIDNSGGTIGVTLPAAGAGKACGFRISSQSVSNAKDVTITRAGSDTIAGGTSLVLDQAGENYILRVDASNTNWRIEG